MYYSGVALPLMALLLAVALAVVSMGVIYVLEYNGTQEQGV